jgi:MtrB/PioB family decaheme-associated outer membrane protein
MRTTRASLIVAVLTVLVTAASASAQLQLGPVNVEGEIIAGARVFLEEPSDSRKGKFEEYRDIPEGLFLDRFSLRLFRPDESYSLEFDGSKWGQDDQEFGLRVGRLGLWQFGFEWDQMQHVYSTTSQFLATENTRGVFTLPTPRPLLPTHNQAPGIDELKTQWDTARIFLSATPTPDLDLRAEYTRIKKDGNRPYGMAFGSPGGNFYEILEPIDQTVHDVRFRATYARERWQIQLGYAFSMFENSLTKVVADNPCFGLAGAIAAGQCGATDGGAAAPATGQTSLPPDNMAHTVTLAGGITLPMQTRLTANASYSLRLQNEKFLPHTINPALSSPALALPEDSLDAMVGVTLINLNASTRPFRPLTLSLRYRLYDLNDMTDELTFPGHVVNDRGPVVVEDRLAGRFEYTRQNADADAKMRLTQPLLFTLGGGWERWDRNSHREVPTSDEYYALGGLNWTPTDWLLAKLTYRPSWRRIDEYNTFAHAAHTVTEEELPSAEAQGQSTLLRKFDEADRDRQRVDLLLQFMPTDSLTTSIGGGWMHDNYNDSPLGLQEATTWSAGIDVNWMPLERLSIYGGYTHESIYQNQRSRSRPVTGATTFDFTDFDWISVHTDTIDTAFLGTTVRLIPKVLDWTANASYAYALGRVQSRNPVAPTSGTATQNATATARSFPAFEDQLLRVESALQYHFWKMWTASFGYVYESFQKNDWRTDRLNPFVPGVTSIWLGNDARNYDAHWVAVTLGVRFR